MKILLILSSLLFLSSCFGGKNKAEPKAQPKTQPKVALGKKVFNKNCMVCHGKIAVGLTKDWKEPLSNGTYPAPPLNGTAHTWHHPPELLLNIINDGGAEIGGWMPAFKDQLSEEEKQAVLDYLYSLWPKEIQQQYESRFK